MVKIINSLAESEELQEAACKWRLEATVEAPTLPQAHRIVDLTGLLEPGRALRPTGTFAGITVQTVTIEQYVQQWRTLFAKAVSLGIIKGRKSSRPSTLQIAMVRDLWNALGYGDGRGLHRRQRWWRDEITVAEQVPENPGERYPHEAKSGRQLWALWRYDIKCPSCSTIGGFILCGTVRAFRCRCEACPRKGGQHKHSFNESQFKVSII